MTRRGAAITLGIAVGAAIGAPAPTYSQTESAMSVAERIVRIDRLDPTLKAFITIIRQPDAPVAGVLAGRIAAIKDNLAVAGVVTTAGSKRLLGRAVSAPADATSVARLRAAGAVIVGTTNLDTFARGTSTISEVRGATVNPLDPTRSPSGSSGGSAVAVKTEMADIALGTDTCGSLRYPAAAVQVVGLRPTPGLVSRVGLVPLAPSYDVVGPIARDVATLSIALSTIAGADAADPLTVAAPRFTPESSPPRDGSAPRFRIGVLDRLVAGADRPIRQAIARTLDRIDDAPTLGLDLVHLDWSAPPAGLVIEDEFRPALAVWEAGGDWMGRLPVKDTKGYRDRLEQGRRSRARIVGLLDDHRLDAIAYPSNRYAPARVGRRGPSDYCQMAAAAGLPALSVPVGYPAGFELVGRPFSEARLLAIGREIEKTTGPAPPTTGAATP